MNTCQHVITYIPIEIIKIGKRLRELNLIHVQMIAESIRQCRQVLSPISVYKEKNGKFYKLIAGAHRVEAARLAGLKTIPATIHENMGELDTRLLEIDENLCRNELNALDRAVFLAERKTVYEKIHPETKAGIAGANARFGDANDTMSFAFDVAEKTGLSPRSIQRSVRIYNSIDKDLRNRLASTIIADKQSELLALSRRSPEEQRLIVDTLTRQESPCSSVKAALTEINSETIASPDAEQVALSRLIDLWTRATPRVRKQFIAHVNRNRPLIQTEA